MSKQNLNLIYKINSILIIFFIIKKKSVSDLQVHVG